MGRHISYGVVGCGMMGREHLRNIALLPDADVVAIFEPDAAMRTVAASLAPGAVLVDSLPELLARPELDCVLIASPNHLHSAPLREIAATRALPLMVEKLVAAEIARIAGKKG